MLDIKFIKENRSFVEQGLRKRGFRHLNLISDVLKLDQARKVLIQKIDALRQERKKVAKEREEIKRGRKIREELKQLEKQLAKTERGLKGVLYEIPNLPLDDVPGGPEENFEVVRKHGDPPKFNFVPKDHVDLGENLGIIDITRAVKVSGSRFAYLISDGALLELALINFAIDRLVKKGFIPVIPPTIIKKEITDKLGYWHGGGNENYYLLKDYEVGEDAHTIKELALYLVGTGEHSVVPMHMDEILPKNTLPQRYVAFSSCFRREAGSYGKDVRGILRVHQFDKIEMVSFAKPDDAEAELERLLGFAEGLMQELGLAYRVIKLAAEDLGFPTAKTYDIETWIPSQGRFRETHSISTTTDYQARRLGIRFYDGNKTKFVHILNGTALAVGRTILAILENYQNKDGSITVPEVLRQWMGKDRITISS